MKYLILISLLFSAVCHAMPTQKIDVGKNDALTATISKDHFSKISVGFGYKLTSVHAQSGYLLVTDNPEQGSALIKPKSIAPATFNVLLGDDHGNMYTISVSTQDVKAQHIIIVPEQRQNAVQGSRKVKDSAYRNSTNALFKAMYTNTAQQQLHVREHNEVVPLWVETTITLKASYEDRGKIGRVYEIKNVSSEDMRFHEQEFLHFGQDVIAVGLESNAIAPNQVTTLYTVSFVGGDR